MPYLCAVHGDCATDAIGACLNRLQHYGLSEAKASVDMDEEVASLLASILPLRPEPPQSRNNLRELAGQDFTSGVLGDEGKRPQRHWQRGQKSHEVDNTF